MDIRPVLYVVGILLSTLAISMVIPMLVDMHAGDSDWRVFFISMIITAFFAGALILTNSSKQDFTINIKQAFLLTCLSWILISAFGAIPFWLSKLDISYTDSFFEAMSGVTTTGSTVITGLDNAPNGILMWRSLLQWLGGIGIIVMAISVLPFLKVGGMQLFKTESSENEKALPRATKLASSIGLIYLALTLICIIGYLMSGMTLFDASSHAMTTIATGGFSTKDTSFGWFDNVQAEMIAIIFMILGGLPFVLYLKMVRGDLTCLYKDSQVRWFISIIITSIIATVIYMASNMDIPFTEALRRAAFNVVSIVTGTGFTNGDYNLWGGFAISLFFFLTVVGGCAGSTSCGIKIFRFQILHAITVNQIKQLLHPSGIFIPHYNGKPLSRDAASSVLSFFFMFALCFSITVIALSFVGLDFITAMSGAATTIANVGPGLGPIIGPSGNFQPLPDSAKWILSISMLLGRLELFTLLVLLTPYFWKK